MTQANLTRLGPVQLKHTPGQSNTFNAAFKAIEAPAQLVVQHDAIDGVELIVNGQAIDALQSLEGTGEGVVPLTLQPNNTIELATSGAAPGQLHLRVTQITEADLGLVCQGYFGLNTSNMETQRAFYDLLGFKGEIYPAGPETSTTFARSLGFEDDYLIYVSLHSLQDPPTMPFVDTVQFRGESFRDEAPYEKLNHLGMAYATYSTTDLDRDYAFLNENGVAFVSAPATAPDGERFVFMKDQDGAYLKLTHTDTADGSGATAPNLVRLINTNMNVSDLERSREFYRLLGFTESKPSSLSGSGEFAEAHGFDGPIEFEGVDVSLGEGTDGATLQLRQWKQPYDDEPSYPPPVNHLGIDRINFYVKDLTAVVETMNALGFEQLGPIGGSPEIGIVFFFDPDGIKVQFAGPQTRSS